jgi:PTS system mannitol-specific IIC component
MATHSEAATPGGPQDLPVPVESTQESIAPMRAQVLVGDSIVLNGTAASRDGAIDEAGALLLARDAVNQEYVASMHAREASVSTYMGNFLAIPHGTNEAKGNISSTAVSIVCYPRGIDWNGQEVRFVVGIAGVNHEHLAILSTVARVFADKERVLRLENATTREEVLDIFGKVNAS